MNQLVSFTHGESAYPISIIDNNGERWASAQEVGEALGTANIRDLIKSLRESGELVEGKHFCRINLRKSEKGNPNILVLSIRGIIRVAMRSQGERAIAFRDWAESVLYEVMVTGTYSGKPILNSKNYKEAQEIAMSFIKMAKGMGTSVEMARAIGLEAAKRETGVDFTPLLIGCNSVEERPLNVTDLGKKMVPVVGARKMNEILCEAGFQFKNDKDEWELTPDGKPFASLEPVKFRNNDGSGYQIRWFPRVISELTIIGEKESPKPVQQSLPLPA